MNSETKLVTKTLGDCKYQFYHSIKDGEALFELNKIEIDGVTYFAYYNIYNDVNLRQMTMFVAGFIEGIRANKKQ